MQFKVTMIQVKIKTCRTKKRGSPSLLWCPEYHMHNALVILRPVLAFKDARVTEVIT